MYINKLFIVLIGIIFIIMTAIIIYQNKSNKNKYDSDVSLYSENITAYNTNIPSFNPYPEEALLPVYPDISPTPSAIPTEPASSIILENENTAPSKIPSSAPQNTPLPTKPAANNSNNISKASNIKPLQIIGTNLCDSDGDIVILRGMSTHGIGWFPQFATKSYMKTLKDEWNSNVFRIAMYTDTNEGYINNKENTRKKVYALVDAAIDLELYVIVDWHILSDNNPSRYQSESIEFFSDLSKKYANVPNVIYEICNEPNGGVTWDNDIKPYAEAVIPEIRKNSPDAIIIVGTPTWSQDVDIAANNPLSYENIMYALHFYSGTHKDFLRQKAKIAISKGLALFVSEWGTTDASGNGNVDIKESQIWLDFLDSYNISWCNWSLCDKDESSAALKPGTPADGSLPDKWLSKSGSFIKKAMSGSVDESKNTEKIPDKVSDIAPDPSRRPSAVGLSIYSYNETRTAKTNTINPRFKLVNNTSDNYKLSDITFRYYYSPDSTITQNFWCDWSSVQGSSGSITGKFSNLSESNFYIEIGFTSSAGIIAPGEDIIVQCRIAASDWSDYDQQNDKSFNPDSADYSLNSTIEIKVNK